MTRDELITDMRKLLTFLKQHPDLPFDAYTARITFTICEDDDEFGHAEIARIAALLGVEPYTTADGTHHHAHRAFGTVTYEANYVDSDRMTRHHAEIRHIQECMPPYLPPVDGQVVDEQRALAGAVSGE